MEVPYKTLYMGTDPEFFFKHDKDVVGAEKVLPKEGLEVVVDQQWNDQNQIVDIKRKVAIIDGVQAEFQVQHGTCRQSISGSIQQCFIQVRNHLNGPAAGLGLHTYFGVGVEVPEEEMMSLSPESREFGCAPSKNIYGDYPIPVKDASKYSFRAAGGHIHFSAYGSKEHDTKLREALGVVRMLDILVGNTCVLIDRDSANIERRKCYGRAGEYRLPAHGLEYRTLSNFWLRSYSLMSFVFAMARFAFLVSMVPAVEKEILDHVDMDKIRRAINENDYELAWDNFEAIKDIIRSITIPGSNGAATYPLEGKRMELFLHFLQDGVPFWFPEDAMTAWTKPDALVNGWEKFLELVVAKAPQASNIKLQEVA